MKTYYEIDLSCNYTKRTKMTDVELKVLLEEAHQEGVIPTSEISTENLLEVFTCDPKFEARLEEGKIVQGSFPAEINIGAFFYDSVDTEVNY